MEKIYIKNTLNIFYPILKSNLIYFLHYPFLPKRNLPFFLRRLTAAKSRPSLPIVGPRSRPFAKIKMDKLSALPSWAVAALAAPVLLCALPMLIFLAPALVCVWALLVVLQIVAPKQLPAALNEFYWLTASAAAVTSSIRVAREAISTARTNPVRKRNCNSGSRCSSPRRGTRRDVRHSRNKNRKLAKSPRGRV